MTGKPIYIVGVGRSGTSLLQSMLGSHPQIYTVPETSFLRRYVFSHENNQPLAETDSHLDRIPGLKANLLGKTKKTELLDLYNQELFLNSDSKYILDKDPRLIEYIPTLQKVIPNAKVIVVYRDPRDVLASKMKARWSAGRHLISYLVSSKVQLNDGRLLATNNEVFFVKYENLLSDAGLVLNEVCGYLEVKFDSGMLDFQSVAQKLVQKDEMDWKKETLQPLNKNNINNWKNQLSNLEAYVSYLNVKNFCDENKYQNIKVDNITKFKGYVCASLANLASKIYIWKRGIAIDKLEREFDEN